MEKINRASGTCKKIPKWLTFLQLVPEKKKRKNAEQNFFWKNTVKTFQIWQKKKKKSTDSKSSANLKEDNHPYPNPHLYIT